MEDDAGIPLKRRGPFSRWAVRGGSSQEVRSQRAVNHSAVSTRPGSESSSVMSAEVAQWLCTVTPGRKWAGRPAPCRALCQLRGRTRHLPPDAHDLETGHSCRFPRGPGAGWSWAVSGTPRSPGDAACVHGRGRASLLTVRYVSGDAFCLPCGYHHVRAERALLAGRGCLAAALTLHRPWPVQAWGASCSVAGPQPLTTCFRKSQLRAGGGRRQFPFT